MKNKYIKELNSIHASESFKEEMIEKMYRQESSLSFPWMKVSLACICACLILISVVSVNVWNELNHTNRILSSIHKELNHYILRNDKTEPIDSILGSLNLSDAMGMQGIFTKSVEELAIDSSTLDVTSLPIFKNPNHRKDSGEIINLKPLSERKQLFNQYLKRYNMENLEIVEEFDTLVVRNNQITLRFYDNDKISMWLNEEYPNQYSIQIYGNTKEEVIQNVKQLLSEYANWFNGNEYNIEINEHYYIYYGQENELRVGWDIDTSNDNEIITFDVNEEGKLQGIKYTIQTKKDVYDRYPIITVEQAKELLFEGYYYIDGPYGNMNNIVGMEIQYAGTGEYLLPYYVVYMPALDQNSRNEFKGLIEYAKAYVPAIDADLLAQDNIYYPNINKGD